MKVKVLKFTNNHGFHGNRCFSRKKFNFMENVAAVKLWIKLVPKHGLVSFRLNTLIRSKSFLEKHTKGV